MSCLSRSEARKLLDFVKSSPLILINSSQDTFPFFKYSKDLDVSQTRTLKQSTISCSSSFVIIVSASHPELWVTLGHCRKELPFRSQMNFNLLRLKNLRDSVDFQCTLTCTGNLSMFKTRYIPM